MENKKDAIEKEFDLADEIISSHPILNFSPGDLRRLNKCVEVYLAEWDEVERQFWLEYYEDEWRCPKQ